MCKFYKFRRVLLIIMREFIKFGAERLAGRTLLRYLGIGASAAAGAVFSYKSYKNLDVVREFERAYIKPLKGEANKWRDIRSQLEGAVTELVYFQKRHFISETKGIGTLDERYVEVHQPDPKAAYSLVEKANEACSMCKDQFKEYLPRRLSPVLEDLTRAYEHQGRPDYSRTIASINDSVLAVKKVISNYDYDISAYNKIKDKLKNKAYTDAGLSTVKLMTGIGKRAGQK